MSFHIEDFISYLCIFSHVATKEFLKVKLQFLRSDLENKLSLAYQWMFVGSLKPPGDEKEIATLLAFEVYKNFRKTACERNSEKLNKIIKQTYYQRHHINLIVCPWEENPELVSF